VEAQTVVASASNGRCGNPPPVSSTQATDRVGRLELIDVFARTTEIGALRRTTRRVGEKCAFATIAAASGGEVGWRPTVPDRPVGTSSVASNRSRPVEAPAEIAFEAGVSGTPRAGGGLLLSEIAMLRFGAAQSPTQVKTDGL